MYSLLTTLGVLLGYWVLRLVDDPRARRFYCFYVLAALAAIYTHYFAFFLIMALGLAFLFDQWRTQAATRQSALRATLVASRNFLLANLVILVLYLPWFTFLFTRLAVDASYWQGQLKFWEALRSVMISFTSGQTVDETQAVWLLIPYGIITLMAIIALGWYSTPRPGVSIRFLPPNGHPSLHAEPGNESENGFRTPYFGVPSGPRILYYSLCWLIIPVVAVLVLASFAPKFNARYVMMALPGLILIWAAGFSTAMVHREWRLETGDWMQRINLQSPVSFLSLIFILTTAFYADGHWFFTPAFTKDDWRDVAAFLHARIQPDETVILVSGHAWPVWQYYAPDLPAVRLPNIDVLDVNAVLTFANSAAPLRAAFTKESGKNGAWLVEWQDDVVDPTGIVPVQLELAGREKGQPTSFWKLKLRRFTNIKPKHIADAPPIATPTQANFGNQLLLHGYTVVDNGDLLLFWERSAQAPLVDIQMTGEVWRADGTLVAPLPDQRPAGYGYPVARWPLGTLVMGRIPAAIWLGNQVTDGTYKLRLSVYTVTLGELHKLPLPDGKDFIELTPLIVRLD